MVALTCALSAVRLAGDRGAVPVRLDGVQGAVALPGLRRAVRPGEAAVTVASRATRTPAADLPPADGLPPWNRLTDDAVAVTLRRAGRSCATAYAFEPGQHLTVRRVIDGDEIRRSYSICSTPSAGRAGAGPDRGTGDRRRRVLRLRARRRCGRATRSTCCRRWATSPPSSRRTGPATTPPSWPAPGSRRCCRWWPPRWRPSRRAGSPCCTATARAATVMFAEELADLKDRYPHGCTWSTCCPASRSSRPLLSGRVDADRLRGDPRQRAGRRVHCGRMVPLWTVRHGGRRPGRAGRARRAAQRPSTPNCSMWRADPAPPPRSADEPRGDGATVTIVLDGRESTVHDGPRRAGARRRAAGAR